MSLIVFIAAVGVALAFVLIPTFAFVILMRLIGMRERVALGQLTPPEEKWPQ